MNRPQLPPQNLDDFAELVTNVNRLAKSVNGPARQTAYAFKHELVSAAITCLPDQTEVDYQFDDRRNETLVLVRMQGSRKRVFHVPFHALSRGAQVQVINSKGTPSAFERNYQLQA